MAQKPIKLVQLTKDFAMKPKDVIDVFHDLGIEKKSGASVDETEIEIFLQKMTKSHQIENMDDYVEGKAKIHIEYEKKQEEEKTPAAPVKEEKPVVETPVKSAVPKAAPAPVAQNRQAPVANARPGFAGQQPRGNMPQRDGTRPFDNRQGTPRPFDNRQGQNNRPTDNRQGQNRPFDNRQGQQPRSFDNRGGNRPFDNRNQGQQQRPAYGKYTAQPQENPFAKKYNQMVRGGMQADSLRPTGNAAPNTERPAQKALLEKQERIARAQAELKAKTQAERPSAPKKEEKKVQRQQYKTITPTYDPSSVKGGVNIGGDYEATAPKTRVIDTRTADVNLSKYDEHYNDQYFAIMNGGDSKAQKQKLKKQDNRGQNVKSSKDKQKAAAEKMKRMEAELARKKQLEITVPDEITVVELASRMKKTSAEVIKRLMIMGEMKGLNDTVDYATAEIVADEFGVKVTKEIVVTIEEKLFTEDVDKEEELETRAPVVCVMGHVDHGKTSILDAIRHTNVTHGEAGGITQAIGAYRVKVNDHDITFLDTPGHEAFTAMRMRGAKSTDIAILVVAADDGVMPQTVEAINHAKAAGIDIIVAINKMDKPQANPDNVLNQLTQYELVPEAWGGDVICVPVSAHTGMGINDLLESVLLVAEVKELIANPNRRAKGIVLESRLDKGCGPVATILVQNGTLHQGDYVIVGNTVGRVRVMKDDKGKSIKVAGPSVPVEITGLTDVPQAGDELNAVEDERMAKELADKRREELRQENLAARSRVNLDDLFTQISEGTKSLNIIVKADVAGSAEAVKASLLKLSGEEVKVAVIHTGVGGITESDVMLATASNAIIVGFNVRPDKNAIDSAERNGVDIRTHRIIYEIIDEVEAAMKGMLAPTFKEVVLGHAEVRKTIHVPNVGTIAGSYVQDGKITRQSQIRVVRDGIVIFEDKISSLRRFKDDVREVAEGYECGVGLDKFNDIKENDILEAFIMEEVKA